MRQSQITKFAATADKRASRAGKVYQALLPEEGSSLRGDHRRVPGATQFLGQFAAAGQALHLLHPLENSEKLEELVNSGTRTRLVAKRAMDGSFHGQDLLAGVKRRGPAVQTFGAHIASYKQAALRRQAAWVSARCAPTR